MKFSKSLFILLITGLMFALSGAFVTANIDVGCMAISDFADATSIFANPVIFNDVSGGEFIAYAAPMLLLFNFTTLATKPAGPHAGGGWHQIYIALASDILTIPDRDGSNKAVISNNIVFKTGKGWNLLYATKDKIKLTEKGSGKRDNDSVTSEFVAKYPGLGEIMRQFLSEHGTDEYYLLIRKCNSQYPILFGRKCNPAFIDWEYDSGENAEDDNDTSLKFMSKGPYLSAIYKGVFTANQGVIAADDATPDVSTGSVFITSANTGATAITDLDNPVVGSTIRILGGSDTNSSTIADGGNFSLTAAMTLGVGSFIDLYIRADNDYVELLRG